VHLQLESNISNNSLTSCLAIVSIIHLRQVSFLYGEGKGVDDKGCRGNMGRS
jgi:hypothetical protein